MATIRVLMECKTAQDVPPVKDYINSIGGQVVDEIESMNMIVATIPANKLNELKQNKGILYAELDAPVEPAEAPDWHLDVMNVKAAHNAGHKGQGVVVGIVDSGVDYNNRNLKPNFLNGYNVTKMWPDAMDIKGHGTKVAGLICACGPDIIGIAPQAKMRCVNVYRTDGQSSISYIVKGIQWCLDEGVDVINLSIYSTMKSTAFDTIAAKAKAKGVILVASAGNGRDIPVIAPASQEGYIAVTALRYTDNVLTVWLSAHGPEVDICAPGSRILSTALGDNTYYFAGTSAASACITGIVALLKEMNPGLSGDALVNKLYSICVQKDNIVVGNEYGKGMPVVGASVSEQKFPVTVSSYPVGATIKVV